MNHRRLSIAIASSLAALFLIFNIGLPVMLSMCPMMDSPRCTCACQSSSDGGPVLTYVHSSCCTTTFLAERNTVPFLGVVKYNPPHCEVSPVIGGTTAVSVLHYQQHLCSIAISDTGPPGTEIPLYLMSSSLLI
jgi:hypothetical protein